MASRTLRQGDIVSISDPSTFLIDTAIPTVVAEDHPTDVSATIQARRGGCALYRGHAVPGSQATSRIWATNPPSWVTPM